MGDVREGVDLRLQGVDAVKRCLDELGGAQLTGADERGELDGGAREQILHGAAH